MRLCNNCGVELDSNMACCPLCNRPVDEDSISSSLQSFAEEQMHHKHRNITSIERNRLFLEVSAIVLGSGVVVTLILDLLVNKKITWSLYNLMASLTLFVNISALTFRRKWPYMVVWGSLLVNTLFLIVLDGNYLNLTWSVKLAIPLMVAFYLFFIVTFKIVHSVKQKGFNLPAIVFISIGLFLIFTEAVISLYINDIIHLSWSLIVGVSIIPIIVLLCYIHYRLKKRFDLKRFFNI